MLALANLLPEILSLYEAEDIRTGTVQALTMATKEQQKKWLALYHSDDYAPTDYQLKAWLTGDAQIETKFALFDMTNFDGQIITDLFGETEYFSDPDQFWPLQNAAIAEAVNDWKAEGWTDVVVLERGAYFDRYEHGQRSMEQGGKVYVQVGHDGTVTPFIGYLPRADIKKIDAILGKGTDAKPKAKSDKPEMSGPLVQYVDLHRHSVIRATLLDHPKVALRLTVAHMLVGSDRWSVEPQKTTARKESTTESVATSKGAGLLETERQAIYDLVGISQFDSPYSPNKRLADGDIVDIFAKLLTLDDETVLRVMTLAMAESLEAGGEIVEALTYAMPIDMKSLWAPDDAFFGILRDKRVINAMVKDIAGKRTADGVLTDTGKAQKQIIRNRMAGHGAEAKPDWRPKWMQVPATHYLDAMTCPPSFIDKSVAKIMQASQKPEAKQAA